MLKVVYYIIWIWYAILTMSYEGFVTILLTALGVMLAVMAIIIGVVAVFGYGQIKEEVTKAATKHAGDAMAAKMEAKLKEYPDAAQFIELYRELQGFYLIQKESLEKLVPKAVAPAPNVAVQMGGAQPVPAESPITPLASYPGEEQEDASSPSQPPADAPDGGADHS